MTKLVGILNITPDSFSDGGDYIDHKAAIAHLDRLFEGGADVVDIGAESTRPGATPLSASEEWERLEPFFAALTNDHMTKILSLDTRHAENAARALDKGFGWVNDVSGFSDEAMVDAVKNYDCQLVYMHSLTVPADPAHILPESVDVIGELVTFAKQKKQSLEAVGIATSRLIFDPGIGFGKTTAQSREILQKVTELTSLEIPLLIGHSRKSFLSSEGLGRDEATLRWSTMLMSAGVDYLRVHDIAAHVKLRNELGHG